MTEEAPIDRAQLAEFTGGDPDIETDILTVFFENAPDYIVALEAAEPGDDWRQKAHRLKGAARGIGAWPLARAAERAERTEPDELATRRAGLLALVRAEYDRLEAAFKP